MRFNNNNRCQLLIEAKASVDLATGTPVLDIDGTEHACTWDGAAVHDTAAGTWTRQGHTDDYFAGPAVPADDIDGAVPLTLGIHSAELRVTIGATMIATELPDFRVQ